MASGFWWSSGQAETEMLEGGTRGAVEGGVLCRLAGEACNCKKPPEVIWNWMDSLEFNHHQAGSSEDSLALVHVLLLLFCL
jgi:hypothetical protein